MKTLRISLLAILVAAPVSAQDRGIIAGRVLERTSGRPITSAIVEVTTPNGSRSVRTDTAGHYRIVDVPSGMQALRVRSIGYTPAADSVRVLPGGSVVQNVTLGAIAEVLQQERGGEVLPRWKGPRPE